jgi:cytidylate kinase
MFYQIFKANQSDMKPFIVVAIDGVAGSGKSTTAQNVANRLHFLHVDTGSHYRSVTVALMKSNVSPEQASNPGNLNKFNLSSSISSNKSQILINGTSFPTDILRSENVNSVVSSYASIPSVRDLLFKYQRSQIELARSQNFNGLVMEGRDIGSIIFPDANLKIYLTANEKIRNHRRATDGENDKILLRDKIDSTRKVAPLVKLKDSIVIDTGKLSAEDVFSQISHLIDSL